MSVEMCTLCKIQILRHLSILFVLPYQHLPVSIKLLHYQHIRIPLIIYIYVSMLYKHILCFPASYTYLCFNANNNKFPGNESYLCLNSVESDFF